MRHSGGHAVIGMTGGRAPCCLIRMCPCSLLKGRQSTTNRTMAGHALTCDRLVELRSLNLSPYERFRRLFSSDLCTGLITRGLPGPIRTSAAYPCLYVGVPTSRRVSFSSDVNPAPGDATRWMNYEN